MELAGKYAYAGREWVARKVVSILGGNEVDMIHNHHNYAWKESHFGEELVVVRKGATPAFPEQRGFVGGSMGDDSVILRGSTWDDTYALQQSALFSTVHGAGRVMSRTEAKGKVSKQGVVKKVGRVTATMMNSWLDERGVIRRGGDLDEAPHVYKRLDDVIARQHNTVVVQERLHPVIVCMAPSSIHDPYKD
jgi:tRNA-splicing ligase RtcB